MPIPIRTAAPVSRPAAKQSASISPSKTKAPGGGARTPTDPDSHVPEQQKNIPSTDFVDHGTASTVSTRTDGGTAAKSGSSYSTISSTGNIARQKPNFGAPGDRQGEDQGGVSDKATSKVKTGLHSGTGSVSSTTTSANAPTSTFTAKSTTTRAGTGHGTGSALTQRGNGNGNGNDSTATRHARTISSSTASLTKQTPQRLAGAHGLQSSSKLSVSALASSRLSKPTLVKPRKTADGLGRKVPNEALRDELLQLQIVFASACQVLSEFEEDVDRKDATEKARVEAVGAEVRRLEALDRSAWNARSLRDLAEVVEADGDTMESFWQRVSLALNKVNVYVRGLSKEAGDGDGDGDKDGYKDGDRDGAGDFGVLVDSLVEHVTKRFTRDTGSKANLSSPSPSYDQDQQQSELYDLDSPINDQARADLLRNQQDLALQVEILKAVPKTNAHLGLATMIRRHLDAANVLLALYAAVVKIDQFLEDQRNLRRSTEVQLAIEEARGRGLRSERVLQLPIWSTSR